MHDQNSSARYSATKNCLQLWPTYNRHSAEASLRSHMVKLLFHIFLIYNGYKLVMICKPSQTVTVTTAQRLTPIRWSVQSQVVVSVQCPQTCEQPFSHCKFQPVADCKQNSMKSSGSHRLFRCFLSNIGFTVSLLYVSCDRVNRCTDMLLVAACKVALLTSLTNLTPSNLWDFQIWSDNWKTYLMIWKGA